MIYFMLFWVDLLALNTVLMISFIQTLMLREFNTWAADLYHPWYCITGQRSSNREWPSKSAWRFHYKAGPGSPITLTLSPLRRLERYILPKLFMFLSVFPELYLRKLLKIYLLTCDVTRCCPWRWCWLGWYRWLENQLFSCPGAVSLLYAGKWCSL